MISFIDEHRSVFGVEPICRILPIAPSTYYENVAKRLDVDRLSMRNRRDIAMKIEIRRVFNENFQVYGVRKVWRQLQREGFEIARCTVARLMRVMGLQGIIRGKPVKTTVSDKAAPCPLDRVNRQFFAPVHSDNLGEDSYCLTCTCSRADGSLPHEIVPFHRASIHWLRSDFGYRSKDHDMCFFSPPLLNSSLDSAQQLVRVFIGIASLKPFQQLAARSPWLLIKP